jgi:hypothetical protein
MSPKSASASPEKDRAPAPERWLAKRPSTDRRIGATDEFREGTESAEMTTSGVAAVEPPNLRRFR